MFEEIKTLRSNRRLLAILVARELAARNAGSVLGVLWLYVQPLAMLAAYFILFDFVLKVRLGEDGPVGRMGQYLVVGMVPWMMFSEALARGSTSLIESGGLLQKNALPLILFPARTTLTVAVVFLPFFIALGFWAMSRHGALSGVAAVPVLIVLQWGLVFVSAYLLAVLIAAMRDVQQFLIFLLSIGLFLSPVLYPPDFLPDAVRWLLWANPATPYILSWHEIVIFGAWPDLRLWAAMIAWLLGASALLAVCLRRARENVVDWL